MLTVQFNDAGQITAFNPLIPSGRPHIDAMKIMHDSLGRPSQIVWGTSAIVFVYDRLSRITSISAVAEGANYLER